MKCEPILRWQEIGIAILLPLCIAGGVRFAWQHSPRSIATVDGSFPRPAAEAATKSDADDAPERRAGAESADSTLSRAFDTFQRTLGPDGIFVLTTWRELADKFSSDGNIGADDPFYRLILDSCIRTVGPEHHGTLKWMDEIAYQFGNMGGKGKEGDRREEAESLLRRALEIRERTLGPDHPETLKSVDRLALRLCNTVIKAKAAEPFYQRSVESRLRLFGPAHDETLDAMTRLADYLNARRREPEAEAFYRQVIAVRERTLGPEHSKTLTAMIHLAGFFFNQQIDKTVSLHRRVLEIRERTLGPDHSDTIAGRMNLAGTLAEKGEYDEAETLRRKNVESYERLHGPDDDGTCIQAMNLATLLRKAGKTAEAKEAAWRAYRGLAKTTARKSAWLEDARNLLIEMGESVPDAPNGGGK